MQSMHLSKGPRSWCRAVLTGWGHGVKLIQKDTGVATGQREGDDLSCQTADLERGRSVVLKDAGVVFGSRARNKYNIPPGAPTYTKHQVSSSPPMLRWAERVQRASVVQVFSPIQRISGKQQSWANDMLPIRDQFQEEMLERVRGKEWEISGGGTPCGGTTGSQPEKLSHT